MRRERRRRLHAGRRRDGFAGLWRLRERLAEPQPNLRLSVCLGGVDRVAVLDRNISPGHGGIFAEEIRAALYDVPPEDRPILFGYILGLGGRDVTPAVIDDIIDNTRSKAQPEREDLWVGVEL